MIREIDRVLLRLIDYGVKDKFFKALKNEAGDDGGFMLTHNFNR